MPRRVVRRLRVLERRLEAERASWVRTAERARQRWEGRVRWLQERIGNAAAGLARAVASRLEVPSRAEVERLRKRIGELEVRVARGGAMGGVKRGPAA